MRNYMLLLIWVIVPLVCCSQTAIFPESNACWTYYHFDKGFSAIILTNSDTVLNDGLTYKKIYVSNNDTLVSEDEYYGGIRVDSLLNRIYYYGEMFGEKKKVILFDFNLHVGDTISGNKGYAICNDNYPYLVDSITTEEIRGVSRKCLYLKCVNPFAYSHKIVEGIGNDRYPILACLDFIPTNSPTLRCMIHNHSCVWNSYPACDYCWESTSSEPLVVEPNIIHVYPNPFDAYVMIESQVGINFHPSKIRITDLQGKKVTFSSTGSFFMNQAIQVDLSHLTSGIYFLSVEADAIRTHFKLKKD